MHRFARIRADIRDALAVRLALAEKPKGCPVGGRIAPASVLKPRGRAGVLDEKIHIASAFEVDPPVAVGPSTVSSRSVCCSAIWGMYGWADTPCPVASVVANAAVERPGMPVVGGGRNTRSPAVCSDIEH